VVIAKTDDGKIFEIIGCGLVGFASGYHLLVRDPGDCGGSNLRWLKLDKLNPARIRVFNF